jgi:hypothetical protein
MTQFYCYPLHRDMDPHPVVADTPEQAAVHAAQTTQMGGRWIVAAEWDGAAPDYLLTERRSYTAERVDNAPPF